MGRGTGLQGVNHSTNWGGCAPVLVRDRVLILYLQSHE